MRRPWRSQAVRPGTDAGYLPWQFSFQKFRGFRRLRMFEECVCRSTFHESAFMHEQDLVADSPRLPEVVRDHHNLGSRTMQRVDDPLDLVRGAGIEIRS